MTAIHFSKLMITTVYCIMFGKKPDTRPVKDHYCIQNDKIISITISANDFLCVAWMLCNQFNYRYEISNCVAGLAYFIGSAGMGAA
jgi:hypothetical protein